MSFSNNIYDSGSSNTANSYVQVLDIEQELNTRTQEIVSNQGFLDTNHDTGSYPILRELLRFTVTSINTPPLDPQKRQLRQRIETVKENYLTFCQQNNIVQSQDDDEPRVFAAIRNQADHLAARVLAERKVEKIVNFRPQLDLKTVRAKRPEEIEILYNEILEEEKGIQKLGDNFSDLIDCANIDENLEDQYAITVKRSTHSNAKNLHKKAITPLTTKQKGYRAAGIAMIVATIAIAVVAATFTALFAPIFAAIFIGTAATAAIGIPFLILSKRQDQSRIVNESSTQSDSLVDIEVSDNLLLGYSVFLLLRNNDIVSGNYEGESRFVLSKEQLQQLNRSLDKNIRWKDDIELIFKGLIGDGEYIQLGQKSNSEILRSPLNLSQAMIKRLKKLPANQPALLFEAFSLCLHDHPERAFYKAEIETIYADLGLRSSNGRIKTFLEADPYRSNLGTNQIEAISPSLNKLIKLKQLILKFTECSTFSAGVEHLQTLGVDRLDYMKQYKIGILQEIYRFVSGDPTHFATLDEEIGGLPSINQIEEKSQQLCIRVLRDYTLPVIEKNETYEFSNDEVIALYEGNPFTTYTENITHKNVSKLFDRLKSSSAYCRIIARTSGYEEGVNDLMRDFNRRLNNYYNLSSTSEYYGRPMVDHAVTNFELLVAQIVYQDQSRVTDDSVEKALIVLNGTLGADLVRGCENGLARRVKRMQDALNPSTGNYILDHLKERKKGLLDAAFQRIYGSNSESSMVYRHQVKAGAYLYLNDPESGDSIPSSITDLNSYSVRPLVQRFFQSYTPEFIYQTVLDFLKEKFRELNTTQEGGLYNDEGMYELLEVLGFGNDREELDKLYRIAGSTENRWQYSFFEQDLPRYLIPYLLKQNILRNKFMHSSASAYIKCCHDVYGTYYRSNPGNNDGSNNSIRRISHAPISAWESAVNQEMDEWISRSIRHYRFYYKISQDQMLNFLQAYDLEAGIRLELRRDIRRDRSSGELDSSQIEAMERIHQRVIRELRQDLSGNEQETFIQRTLRLPLRLL